ncbi:pyridoxal-phosphate-dependent aminotransferase family protein [Algirhabdus cladophorae]|uniref:pyridoxal-phosphate-dependent aminotransferase family protein n=1 Tax=Algirhabdus cladophorae TaxID=3377108 RepID=UPI003B846B92
MSLSNGRHTLAIPGPSVIPEAVLQAMHRPAPNIYTGALIDMTHSLVPDLKSIARTGHHVAMYIANGHGSWEAALSNTMSRGDKILVLATGRFCLGWGEIANRMGVETQILDFGRASDIDTDAMAEALKADKFHEIKAVLAVQVDTSTSVKNDVTALRKVLDDIGHPALLMIDSIACLGCDAFEMDAWGVDVMVTGCQKGLMTPPGMSFVFFNDKADAVRETANCVSHYWDWRPRMAPEMYFQYWDGTAPTHHLYGLRVALDMIIEEGLEAVWARHQTLAHGVWAACDAWGQGGPLAMNIKDPSKRSHAVTSIGIGAPYGTQLRTWLTQEAGVTLGIGLGMGTDEDPNSDGYFRIGHMGHVNAHMMLGTLGAIDAGLKALEIPHGPNAIEAASTVYAKRA